MNTVLYVKRTVYQQISPETFTDEHITVYHVFSVCGITELLKRGEPNAIDGIKAIAQHCQENNLDPAHITIRISRIGVNHSGTVI